MTALPNDHDEIPMEWEKRLDLVAKIVRVDTEEYGIAKADIVIDPLSMPIGADTGNSLVTMEAIRQICDQHGLEHTSVEIEFTEGTLAANQERATKQRWAVPGSSHDKIVRFAKIGLPAAVGGIGAERPRRLTLVTRRGSVAGERNPAIRLPTRHKGAP